MSKTTTKFKLNETAGTTVNVPCIECKRATKHKVLASADEHGEEIFAPHGSVEWVTNYQVVQCLGCESVSFRRASSNSEDFIQTGPEEWDWEEYVELYPPRNAGRTPLKDSSLLPNNVEHIYQETVKAMNNDQSVLAGMGIRALIETVCKDKAAPGKNLLKKIDGLVSQGVLTEDGAKILHKIRTLGNAAAHEVKPHSAAQLSLAMDVVEHTLQGVYILPHHAKKTFN